MRPLTHILIIALSTASPALFAQFTMGGLGTSMGMMGGLQGMGSQAYGTGMGAVNGLQGTMGMTGGMMHGGQCHFSLSKIIKKISGDIGALGQPAGAAAIAGLGFNQWLAIHINKMTAARANVVTVIHS